jgi:NADH-quinone oxidoreductase subunit E
MSNQTQGSLPLVGKVAAGVFLVAFVLLWAFSSMRFGGLFFWSLVIALLAAAYMYFIRGVGSESVETPTDALASSAPAPGKSEPAGDAAASPPPAAPPVPKASEPAPSVAPEPAEASPADVDYDGDGKIEGKDEGTRPATLEGPRGGTADDLKKIKGVGPKLEKVLNGLGFYHYDQIGALTPDEVAWVNANLEGFNGRVTRDKWVEQAQTLASGGETEFSKRVDGGDVY